MAPPLDFDGNKGEHSGTLGLDRNQTCLIAIAHNSSSIQLYMYILKISTTKNNNNTKNNLNLTFLISYTLCLVYVIWTYGFALIRVFVRRRRHI